MRVVIDTNVLVSGLLNAAGNPGRVVDGLLLGELVPVVDDRILAEYSEVLSRPAFAFDPANRDGVLEFLRASAERVVAPPLALVLPDPDDAPFLEVAYHANAVALCTGNTRHYPPEARGGVTVLTPAELVARWTASRSTPA